jgi:dipeptidyl-peptidase-4
MKKFALNCIVLFASSVLAQRPNYSMITNEQIWSLGEFSAKGVRGFRSMNNGEDFTRLEKNQILKYSYENYSGKPTVLVDGQKLKFKGKEIIIENYEFNRDETMVLLATNVEPIYRYSYKAFYFLLDLKTNEIRALDENRSAQMLAEFSPDGTMVSYIYENNLFVKNIKSGRISQLTYDGAKNRIINGTTDWVYEEEFSFTKAYVWSSDSRQIAYLKFDESAVKEFTMTLYGSLYPELYTWKYPKAGEENSKVSLHIQRVDRKKSRKIDLGSYEYIPRLVFSPKNNTLIVQTLNRHQNELHFWKFNVDGNSNSATMFCKISDDAYIEIDDNLLFINDGQSIITTSDKDGFKHIYQIDLSGKMTQITFGPWDVIEVKGYDEQSKQIFFTSSEMGATQRDLFAVNLDTRNKKQLSTKRGHTDAEFSKGMRYFLQTWSDANTPPVYTLHRSNGEQIQVLEDNSALRDKLKNYQLRTKEFLQIKSADGATMLNAWMIKPYGFEENTKFPVYMYVYCGPGSNTVNDRWEGSNFMYHQLLAQKGYIVFSVDSRGTQYRGSRFMKSTYLKLGKLELEDLVAAAEQLKTLPFVDEDRIGIQGWSYGGYMTSLAMTKAAPIFKMGIAVAPVTSWRYYDNIYTERFMRTPMENASGYDDNSPIHFAERLEGKYFIIHGSADDNVHYQNAMEMVNALVKANKQFDMFIYPNRNHGIYGGNTRLHLYNMMLNYTLNNL